MTQGGAESSREADCEWIRYRSHIHEAMPQQKLRQTSSILFQPADPHVTQSNIILVTFGKLQISFFFRSQIAPSLLFCVIFIRRCVLAWESLDAPRRVAFTRKLCTATMSMFRHNRERCAREPSQKCLASTSPRTNRVMCVRVCGWHINGRVSGGRQKCTIFAHSKIVVKSMG